MKKIYLIIAGAFLILLIITSMILSLKEKSAINTQKNSPFPTSIPQGSAYQQSNQQNNQNSSNSSVDISTISPVETLDFKAAYVADLNKIVVEKKTPKAEELFYKWIDQNKLNEVVNKQNKILFTDKKIIPTPSDSIHKLENKLTDFFQLMDDLNSVGRGKNNNKSTVTSNPTPTVIKNNQSPITNNPSLTPLLPVTNPSTNLGQAQSLTYYAQCGDLGNLSLPNGCNLCQAGCGPTAVAMIAASYLGSNYNPKTIVDTYKSNSYPLGCDGSRYSDAKQVLQDLGLKTTDYLVFNAERSDTVVPELRKYINAGWTFFTLARFCDDPKKGYCGHFFWITDIDDQGNIFAYDPAYGRHEIPYNENSRYPYPLYRLVFGVKK